MENKQIQFEEFEAKAPQKPKKGAKTAETTELTLEQAMTKLQEIAAQMEDIKTDFKTGLKLYEEAAGLVAQCKIILEEGKSKIEEINNRINSEN
ncbi:MAG: exodeoxyribonuclease VII small subunit [Oscillospiraceae bacterium]|jgi:exodeoxyribonuclease VII small subunit|nr:exodeoxyribonuclease VII small subunit [Oscillospiraceae bacterium]